MIRKDLVKYEKEFVIGNSTNKRCLKEIGKTKIISTKNTEREEIGDRGKVLKTTEKFEKTLRIHKLRNQNKLRNILSKVTNDRKKALKSKRMKLYTPSIYEEK